MSLPIFYLTLGFPTEEKFFRILEMLDRLKVPAVEIGIPDENPKMDGETIRKTHELIMKRQYKTSTIHSMLSRIIKKHTFETVIMGYYKGLTSHSIIGNDTFKEAHILCVDKELTLNNHEKLIQLYHSGMNQKTISRKLENNTFFAYAMANQSGTGIALGIDDGSLEHSIRSLKSMTKLPVYLGFGIKEPDHATMAGKLGADGIIIGSEFIRLSTQLPVEDLATYVITMAKAFNLFEHHSN